MGAARWLPANFPFTILGVVMNSSVCNQDVQNKVGILLVDDHSVLRQGMAAMINEEPDLEVCAEADGLTAALAILKTARPKVAVVDLSIRDGDGLELIKEILTRYPDIRILVLSMYDESVYADRALRAGALGYVMKAEAANTVIAGIRSVLRGEIYVSETMRAARAKGQPKIGLRARPRELGRLSDRELQVLRCVGRGLSTGEIGEELFISAKTVEAHREHIKQKLGLLTSGELLRYAIEHNRVPQ
jgi:DNA-binding NarL/FixJ family response regulator